MKFSVAVGVVTVAQIAAMDNQLVYERLLGSPCGDVMLMNGYIASHAQAEEDLKETRAAFNVASGQIPWQNADASCRADTAAGAATMIGGFGVGFPIVGSGLTEAIGATTAKGILRG